VAEAQSVLRNLFPEYGARGSLTDDSNETPRTALLEQYGSIVEPYEPSLSERIYNFAFDALGGNEATGLDRQRILRRARYPQRIIDQTALAGITDYSQAMQDYARGDALSGTTNLAMAATSLIPGQQRQAVEEISNRLLKGTFGRTLDTSNIQIPFRSPISPQTDVPQIPFRSDTPAQGQPALRDVFSTTDRNAAGMTPNMVDYQTAGILSRDPNYFKEWKDVDYEIRNMSPDEYLERGAAILRPEGKTIQDVIAGRAKDTDYIDNMARSMQGGQVYAAPYLDYGSGGRGASQEGMHRALAAKQLGMEEIPVMVLDSFKNPKSPYRSALNEMDTPVSNPSTLQDIPNIIGDEPLPGAPQVANIPNLGPYRFGPNPDVEKAAQNYAQMTGMPYTPVQVYSPLDVERAERIAKEYGLMKHDPSSPQVQQAYGALMNELMGQYDSLRKAGYKFVFDENAYQNSPYESLIDIAQNKTLRVYPTSAGFGSGGGADFDVATNPLLAQSGEYFNGIPATYNDIFRAVHDVYGHAKPGVGFRAAGEENAFLSHAGQLSPAARRALTTETRGQNSFLNFGPDGETNRTAGIDETVFADQKTGLLPRWATELGRPETLMRRDDFFQNLKDRGETLEGALAEDGSIILTHYSNKELDRVDPDFYGSKGYARTGDERRRMASPDWVNRSYYGIQGGQNPYQREAMLGTLRHETKIAPELLYDPRANKEKLWSDSDITGSEKKIADNNYSGYYLDHPQLGKVAVVFDPLDVTKKYLIPIGAVGVTSAAVQESKETKDNT
jgi:hypothetical protein